MRITPGECACGSLVGGGEGATRLIRTGLFCKYDFMRVVGEKAFIFM